MYDFPRSVVAKLTSLANKYLKKWLKVTRPASCEIFYLPETGLNIKNPSTFLKCMQLSKHHILTNSKDPTVRFIGESKLLKASKCVSNKWSPERTLVDIQSELKWESIFTPSKSILSSKSCVSFSTASQKTKRNLISTRMKKIGADKMRIRVLDLCRNGSFTTWDLSLIHI